jgi:hypothetical protein
MDEYGYTTSPSSFGGGGHAMAATNSSQSMSSYAESPPSYGWSTEQQQDWYPIYNTTSPTPQAYFAPTEDPAYPSQAPYQQPAQRSQPAQEPPRSQRSTTETAPAYVFLFFLLHPSSPACLSLLLLFLPTSLTAPSHPTEASSVSCRAAKPTAASSGAPTCCAT